MPDQVGGDLFDDRRACPSCSRSSFPNPDRLEEVDEVVLGRFLEARVDDQEAAFEVVDVERGDGFADAARMLVEPGRQLGALTDPVLGGLVARIGLADVDRVAHAIQPRVGAEVAAVVDGVDAGAVKFRDLRQRMLGLGDQGERDDAAGGVGSVG